jgi:hypothetical protein
VSKERRKGRKGTERKGEKGLGRARGGGGERTIVEVEAYEEVAEQSRKSDHHRQSAGCPSELEVRLAVHVVFRIRRLREQAARQVRFVEPYKVAGERGSEPWVVLLREGRKGRPRSPVPAAGEAPAWWCRPLPCSSCFSAGTGGWQSTFEVAEGERPKEREAELEIGVSSRFSVGSRCLLSK